MNQENETQETMHETESPSTDTSAEDTAAQAESSAEAEVTESDALTKAQESIQNLTDRLMRTAAEFDNFKKRSIREKDDIYGVAVCDTVAKLLPVMDNLERAIAAQDEVSADSALLDGVKMVKKQFDDALAAIGVTAMNAVGTPFDPEKHNAVMTEESDQEENTVLEELLRGYLYKDRVIRHAMVKVSQ